MTKHLMNVVGVLFWIPTGALKFVLWAIGLIVVPFTDPQNNPIWGNRVQPYAPIWYRTGQPRWWRNYAWRALRNSANNLRFWFREPTEAWIWGDGDPEGSVRNIMDDTDKAWRFMRSGVFAEYWRIWRTDDGEIAEFRIGWKFGGVPGFAPTFQWRKGA